MDGELPFFLIRYVVESIEIYTRNSVKKVCFAIIPKGARTYGDKCSQMSLVNR